MITDTQVRRSAVGSKKGWCFDVYFSGKEYPNFTSALYKTHKEAEAKLKIYEDVGKFDWYGSAE